ncbi:MAG: MFS transporter, partial [Chloroflexota bacterium]
LAAISALIAVMAIVQLPELPAFTRPKGSSFQLILEAGQYIFKHDLLRPITACALFWNIAFSALLVVLIPFMSEQYNANPNTFGLALAAFGAGGILGSWSISRFSKSVTPNFILLYGPGSSAAAISLLIFPQFFDVNIIYVGFFFLGLGPSMWLIVQNSIRQLATPNQMLGRVNSVIQTAIYGIRPVGALIGGFIAGTLSPSHGMTFVIVMMVCSFAAAVFSRLRNISSLSHVSVLSSRLA